MSMEDTIIINKKVKGLIDNQTDDISGLINNQIGTVNTKLKEVVEEHSEDIEALINNQTTTLNTSQESIKTLINTQTTNINNNVNSKTGAVTTSVNNNVNSKVAEINNNVNSKTSAVTTGINNNVNSKVTEINNNVNNKTSGVTTSVNNNVNSKTSAVTTNVNNNVNSKITALTNLINSQNNASKNNVYIQTLSQCINSESIDWVYRECADLGMVISKAFDISSSALTNCKNMSEIINNESAVSVICNNLSAITCLCKSPYGLNRLCKSKYGSYLTNSRFNNDNLNQIIMETCRNSSKYFEFVILKFINESSSFDRNYYHNIANNSWNSVRVPQYAIYCLTSWQLSAFGYEASLYCYDYDGTATTFAYKNSSKLTLHFNKVAVGSLTVNSATVSSNYVKTYRVL